MSTKYDLAELFKDPDRRLTKDEYEHLDEYLRPTNDDISAKDVDIDEAVGELVTEMNEKGSYWR